MPVYEFVCEKCDCKFEVLSFSAGQAGPPRCPDCGETSTKRILSVTGKGAKGTGRLSGAPSGGGTCGSASGFG